MPSIILISGMHRSGASALTRALNLAGMALPSDSAPSPDPERAMGAWQSAELTRILDAMLRSLRSGWNDPREIPGDWFSGSAGDEARRALTVWIETEMRGKRELVVKDPRICRLLPLWQIVCGGMGIDSYTVIPFRNPIQVAASLKAHGGIPATNALFLWLRHVLDAERFSRGRARCFCSFDQLVKDVPGAVRRVAAELQLDLSNTELGARLAEAPKPGPSPGSDDEATAACKQIPALLVAYQWLLDASQGKSPPFEALDEMTYRMRMSEQTRGIAIAVPGGDTPPSA